MNFVNELKQWFENKLKINFRKEFPQNIKRGEIYWVDFGVNIGSEFNFFRPSVVISSDRENIKRKNICVIPITSFKEENKYDKLDIKIKLKNKIAVIKVQHLRDISKKRVYKRIDTISSKYIKNIEINIKKFLQFEMDGQE